MSDFFKFFNKILGQRQRATMAYQLRANGSADRMVQTPTRALKMIGINVIGTNMLNGSRSRSTPARDRIQVETPFYMIYGWDPRSTLEAVIPVGSTCRHDRDPRRWRYQMEKYYHQAREQVKQRVREVIADRPNT
ncbi:reverse transcriptase [Phytophthora megakarya]|uniref:Reverse transcriptase n=1 Tax=Phytophthora megakarya TaxID=4795 RepID=A0A225W5H3_9STRA|nr:reverse transcriptase [Phytophthora megakarya]